MSRSLSSAASSRSFAAISFAFSSRTSLPSQMMRSRSSRSKTLGWGLMSAISVRLLVRFRGLASTVLSTADRPGDVRRRQSRRPPTSQARPSGAPSAVRSDNCRRCSSSSCPSGQQISVASAGRGRPERYDDERVAIRAASTEVMRLGSRRVAEVVRSGLRRRLGLGGLGLVRRGLVRRAPRAPRRPRAPASG